jgi:hypothetical protein
LFQETKYYKKLHKITFFLKMTNVSNLLNDKIFPCKLTISFLFLTCWLFKLMKYSQHVSQMCKLDLAVVNMCFLQTVEFGNKQLIMTLHNILNLAPSTTQMDLHYIKTCFKCNVKEFNYLHIKLFDDFKWGTIFSFTHQEVFIIQHNNNMKTSNNICQKNIINLLNY